MGRINHTRVATRFAIVVFWAIVVGLAYTTFQNSGNLHALAWGTWLFYTTVSAAIVYLGVIKTINLWNIK